MKKKQNFGLYLRIGWHDLLMIFNSKILVVCCGAEEAGTPHCEHINKKDIKVIFTPTDL